jgi:hypothetical protein
LTCHSRFVFPSLRTPNEPMSENTINGALRRLGYSGDEMTAHGFRATASTLLNESGKWHPDAIERALDQLAAQINAASVEARKAERQSLQNAETSFITITRELTGFVESARTSDRQTKWLVAAFLLGIATRGAFVMLVTRWNSTELPAQIESRPAVHKVR